MDRDKLKNLIIRYEGLKLTVYKDTQGKLTIGVGRNLEDVGITSIEANQLLDNDLNRVVSLCRLNFPWFDSLDDSRQNVIASMVFNMGAGGVAEFKNMIAAIQAKDWSRAADAMLASKWAGQVGSRAVDLANMMRDGDTVH